MNSDFLSAPGGRVALNVSLSGLEQAQLVRVSDELEPTYMFKHALMQDAAFATLLKHDRQRLHREAANALEHLYPELLNENAAQLAEYFAIAEDDAKTFYYAARAGDFASRLHADTEARYYYARALEALARLPASPENASHQMDVLLKQVDVSMFTDDPAQNLARLVQAEAIAKQLPETLGEPDANRLRLAHITLSRGLVHFWRNETHAAIESFLQILPVAHELQDEDLARIPLSAIGSVMTMQGQFGQAAPLLEEALPVLERSGNWSDWVVATGFLALGLAARGRYAEGLAKGQQVLAAAHASKDPTAIAQGHNLVALIYLEGGDILHMLEEGIACTQAAEQSGDRLYQYIGYAIQTWAQSRLGQHEAAFENLARAKALVEDLGTQILGSDWRAAGIAEMAFAAGKPEEAVALAQDAVTLAQSAGGLFAEGLAQRVWGQALAALAPVRWDEAQEHLGASLQLLESGDARLEAARTRVVWGKLLTQHSRDDSVNRLQEDVNHRQDELYRLQAREHFEKAAAQFQESGLAHELAEIEDVMNEVIRAH